MVNLSSGNGKAAVTRPALRYTSNLTGKLESFSSFEILTSLICKNDIYVAVSQILKISCQVKVNAPVLAGKFFLVLKKVFEVFQFSGLNFAIKLIVSKWAEAYTLKIIAQIAYFRKSIVQEIDPVKLLINKQGNNRIQFSAILEKI